MWNNETNMNINKIRSTNKLWLHVLWTWTKYLMHVPGAVCGARAGCAARHRAPRSPTRSTRRRREARDCPGPGQRPSRGRGRWRRREMSRARAEPWTARARGGPRWPWPAPVGPRECSPATHSRPIRVAPPDLSQPPRPRGRRRLSMD